MGYSMTLIDMFLLDPTYKVRRLWFMFLFSLVNFPYSKILLR